MSEPSSEDDRGSLERVRESLYSPHQTIPPRPEVAPIEERVLPHAWEDPTFVLKRGKRHVQLAGIFLAGAVVFFLLALGTAGYFLYIGGNSVSPDKISVTVSGPTTIAGGDTLPLTLSIINKNPVALENATIEIDFPEGTRTATDNPTDYPRYVENLGTLQSGETINRSIKAAVFGAAGQTLTLPVTVSYRTPSSNAVFQKKTSYALVISSTPLSISVDALTETVSGAPLPFTVNVRSNANKPLDNVVVNVAYPFGFSVTSSSLPITNGSIVIGTLAPGATKQILIAGALTGQQGDKRVFHFTVGTATSASDATLAVTYMTQDAPVTITAPFITTSLALNGDTSGNVVVNPGTSQSVNLSYTNTLTVPVTNASVTISIEGNAINYDSIRTTSGYYNSSNHTILFSKDTDPGLASLSPGASGVGTFSFNTLKSGASSPTITFSISVAGTRVGQNNVPEQVTSTNVQTARVATSILFTTRSSHLAGPVQPQPNVSSTYSVIWHVQNTGNAIAGGTASATLPSYITYLGNTSGSGSFSYDTLSRTVSWNLGDLDENASGEGEFQISFLPSTSQSGSVVSFTTPVSFSAYDRFAGVQVSATADPATTESKQDPGYVPTDGVVQ